MTVKKRFFITLWLAGFVGILSFLLLDISKILEIMPPTVEVPQVPFLLIKVVSLIQPTVILTVAVLIGIGLAAKVGLAAPVAEAFSERRAWVDVLRTQIVPGVLGGIVGGLAIVAITAGTKPFLSSEAIDLIGKFGQLMPLPTRLLYGGITEELLLRWGFMTLLVWLAWRLIQRDENKPATWIYVAAILVSSIVFGLGHLPVAFMLFPEPTTALIIFVISANSTFGIVAGMLYWKRGLESAIIAHAVTHIVLYTASHLGGYF